MAAYAEGLNILHHADAGFHQLQIDAETTPMRAPELYQYELDLPDITEAWRRGSVSDSGEAISPRAVPLQLGSDTGACRRLQRSPRQ